VAGISEVTPQRNGRDHTAPPPLIDEDWDRPPQRAPRPAPRGEYSRLLSRYFRLLRELSGIFDKKTLGSDQRVATRAAKTSKKFSELCRVCARLDALERG
jgi:hypothetical protein